MGILFVVLSIVMGILLTGLFGFIPKLAATSPASPGTQDLGATFGLLVIPVAAMVGMMITTPVYLLFVNDKNSGVLEYLLAVGMSQFDVFRGYMKAALYLALIAMVPPILLNIALSPSGLVPALSASGLAVITGLSGVALVTVLMTGFSSMQRKPTGMNSPLGMTLGIFLILPEFILVTALGPALIWLDAAIALGLFGGALLLLALLPRVISREKLLP